MLEKTPDPMAAYEARRQERAEREARAERLAEPCDAWRAGEARIKASIPGITPSTGRMGIRGLGVYATPVWSLELAPELRETGALYAAMSEKLTAGGMRATSIEAVRVDNGGKGEGRELVLTDLARGVAGAHHALDELAPMVPARAGKRERQKISARVAVDRVCILNQTLCEVLDLMDWPQNGRNKRALTEHLGTALGAMYRRWGGGGGSERAARLEPYFAPGAEGGWAANRRAPEDEKQP